MSEKVIKYGVVGLGRGADVAAEGIGMEGAKLCAACDHNPEILEKAKKKFEDLGLTDCAYYSDYDEMLKSDIDAVIVATEAIYHVPIVKKAMEAGKHVLSEIPSINSLEEAHELKAIVSDMPKELVSEFLDLDLCIVRIRSAALIKESIPVVWQHSSFG